MSGDEALWLVAHGVTIQFALGLGCDGSAVRQREAIQRCLGVTLQKGCTGRYKDRLTGLGNIGHQSLQATQ